MPYGLHRIGNELEESSYRSGCSPDWLKMKNANAPAVKREAEEDCRGRGISDQRAGWGCECPITYMCDVPHKACLRLGLKIDFRAAS
jgi:hypothetical protein